MIFPRYNSIIRLTLIFVIFIALILFYWQFQSRYQYEIALLKNKFQEESVTLDDTLKTTADYVEQMRLRAESFYEISQIHKLESILLDSLEEREENGETIYNLDKIPPPYTQKFIGNLTGIGSLKGRDKSFYQELEMAISLNPILQTALEFIPNDISAYYISKQGFANLYPWVNSRQFHFTSDVFTYQFYRLGLPENNPQHQRFWTEAYIDTFTKKLMVTCGSPVYEKDTFRGVVALDITLDVLNQVVAKFKSKIPIGQVFLVNSSQQLLANSYYVEPEKDSLVALGDVVPEKVKKQMELLLSKPALAVQDVGEYLVFYQNLNEAPWKLVFLAPKKEIIFPLLKQLGISLGLLLTGLTLMLAIANLMIKRQFITPASQLIRHIESASKNERPEIPEVPADWQPWFTMISKIFQENQKMTSELVHREKMSSLMQLVAGVAHEVNNPVNFIYGNLDYLKHYCKDIIELMYLYQNAYPQPCPVIQQKIEEIDLDFLVNDLPKLIHSMKVGSERIKEIVVSLRNFSRLDESDKKRVDIHQGLESTLTILENRLQLDNGGKIEIVKKYGDLPLVECYAGQLNQVFLNIIGNGIDAVKESGKDDVKIEITTKMIDEQWLQIAIIDNGLGIDEESRQHLFEPFFTTKAVGKGTGLGLAVSYQIIVDKHKGQLKCNSILGAGTEFLIEIPIAPVGFNPENTIPDGKPNL